MGTDFAYSGLNTKIHGMKGKLLTADEYREICSLSSVPEVIQYLSVHPGYQNLFPDTPDENFFHRENLEQILVLSLFQNFAKLYTFSSMQQRKFLDLYFMHFETRFLKQLLRRLFSHHPLPVDIPLLKPYFDHFSNIPLDKAGAASDIDELLQSLSDTRYYKPLSEVRELTEKSLFDYEICLDLYQFSTLWKMKKKYLKGIDLAVITDAYGCKIDLLNLQWIYRCKKYYRMTAAQILKLVIPVHYKLKNSQIFALTETDSLQNFMNILSSTYYGKDVTDFDHISIEKYYNRLMYKKYIKLFRKNPYSLACVNTYLYLQEQETEKLTLITEGIRYSYPAEEILKMLTSGGDYH